MSTFKHPTIILAELSLRLKGELLPTTQRTISWNGVSSDSRHFAPQQIYCALKGERFDGHDYLDTVLQHNPSLLIVSRLPTASSDMSTSEVPTIVVADTLIALQTLAAWWRDQFDIPVIAVTGSNGKTTVKEMIALILQKQYGADHVLVSPGNFNNHIGVPLSLLRLNSAHQVAVLELGMNHIGEIAQLAQWVKPAIALINNAQREHQEFMESVENTARENGQVLSALNHKAYAIVPTQDEFLPIWRELNHGAHLLRFGIHHDSAVTQHAENYLKDSNYLNARNIQMSARDIRADIYDADRYIAPLFLNMAGRHALSNALAAITSVYALAQYRADTQGAPVSTTDSADECLIHAIQSLVDFAPVKGRMTRHDWTIKQQNWHVIDDSYNANPDSVRAAIDVLAQADHSKILVLGDMGEVGHQGAAFHHEVGAYAQAQGITQLFTLGSLSVSAASAFAHAQHFDQIEQLIEALIHSLSQNKGSLLIKGSRSMQMERVITALSPLNTQDEMCTQKAMMPLKRSAIC